MRELCWILPLVFAGTAFATPWTRTRTVSARAAEETSHERLPGEKSGEDKGKKKYVLTPEDAAEMRRLGTAARLLSRDREVKVRWGPWWAFHFKTKEYDVPVHRLREFTTNAKLWLTLHEMLHHDYSRMPSSELWQNSAFHSLWNALEDVRINKIGLERFEGAKPGYDEYHQQQWGDEVEGNKIPLTRAEQFAGAFYYEAAFGGKPFPRLSQPEVHEAIAEARSHVEEAVRLPRGINLRANEDLTPEEADREAQRSFEVIRNRIWPIYQRLLEADAEDPETEELLRQREEAQGGGDEEEGGESGGGGSSPRRSGKGGAKGKGKSGPGKETIDPERIPEDPLGEGGKGSEKTRRALRKLFERLAKELAGKAEDSDGDEGAETPAGVGAKAGGEGVGHGGEGRPPELDYEGTEGFKLDDQLRALQEQQRHLSSDDGVLSAVKRTVRRVTADLVREIGTAIQRDTRRQFKGPPYFSVGRLDLRRAIKAKIRYLSDGQFTDKLHVRPGDPEQHSAEVVLALDISGSMHGASLDAVRNAFVALQGALTTLAIRNGMLAYDGEPKTLLALGRTPSRAKLAQALAGVAIGENAVNNETGALQLAADMLKRSGAVHRIILVVTDGGCVTDTKKKVDELVAQGFHVVGIGIGAGVEDVAKHFGEERSVRVSDLAQLPRELGNVIKRLITRGS